MRERVLAALDAAQRAWLQGLDLLGLARTVDGQPAWPHAWRFSAQVLAYDAGLLRQLLWTLAAIALALTCAGAALLSQRRTRRHRQVPAPARPHPLLTWPRAWWALAALALLAAPWPPAHLVFTRAVPTSFHQSPTGFEARAIVAGQQLYAAHCASCHGPTARGDGPRAAQGGPNDLWPPTLIGNLLSKRLEGELLWRVRHGWQADEGPHPPHAFGAALSAEQTWQVLDFLRANAAGQNVAEGGGWPQPVRLPRAQSACPAAPASLRTRLVFADTVPADLRPDPRLFTVLVTPAGAASGAADSVAVDCTLDDPDFRTAMAQLLGVPPTSLNGHQVLSDRAGWLRARSTPGAAGWRDDDLLCQTPTGPEAAVADASRPVGEGLDALIARMDAAPLLPLRAGFAHR
ncbi:c-type cytochrome [Comamonas serinivorans]|nr:cytochrome c [Comamonas serinivorans]